MGLLDNMKNKLGPAREKVSGLAQQHGDKVQHGLDRAARVADERTKGRYSDKIEKGRGKAKQAMDRLAQQSHEGGRTREDGHRGHGLGGHGQHGGRARHARHDEGPTPPPSSP